MFVFLLLIANIYMAFMAVHQKKHRDGKAAAQPVQKGLVCRHIYYYLSFVDCHCNFKIMGPQYTY